MSSHTSLFKDLDINALYLAIEAELQILGYSYQKPKDLANAILKSSDFYIEKQGVSPWKSPEFCASYLAHFLPMNVIRLQKGLQRLENLGHKGLLLSTPIYDYGCGPFSFLLSFLLYFKQLPLKYDYYDLSPEALKVGLKILKNLNFKNLDFLGKNIELTTVDKSSLVTLSYSLNELPETQKLKFLSFDQLLIFEPSMQSTSRALLQFRKQALASGHNPLAPCTHNLDCPLLELSKKDWCFDRAHLQISSLATELYKHLPFDNKQVTFSYLFLSKTQTHNNLNSIRVVGDWQQEKGKTKIMICRNQQREFLAILKKQRLDLELHSKLSSLNRGDSFVLPENILTKGNEVRIHDLA